MDLSTPLSAVLHTTKEHVAALKEMGMVTVEDFLQYLPRTHEDLTAMCTLATAPLEEKVSIRGTINAVKLVFTRKRKKIVTARFTDTEGGEAEVLWFNQGHIKRMLSDGDEVVLTGKLKEKGYRLQFMSPTFESTNQDRDLVHAGRLVPVYPQHDIINTKWLREKMQHVRTAIENLSETLPESLCKEEGLLPRCDAVRAMHFPEDPEEVRRARERFLFEDMFVVQCEALERKKAWQGTAQEHLRIPMDIQMMKLFFESLNFHPTNGQKIAIYEILRDMERDRAMSRLLEGDVGSGKTLVATAVIAHVMQHGGQCAFMAPTEVLARQLAQSIGKTLIAFSAFLTEKYKKDGKSLPLEVSVSLLTGSLPASESRRIKQGLCNGTIDLVIGTHALIQESVQFRDLKLVVVDEQHRFGVLQRDQLRSKGSPHFLSMTATPIPRSLALTAYGDHDLSVLTEKPGKRQPIHTKVVPPTERETVERFADQHIEKGRQVFVICPLIQKSDHEEMRDIKNVEREAERLRETFSHRRIATLHGRMSGEEKENIMRDFRECRSDILVSTSVIEVGIDIPNVTIIFIEGSERFGLSQLHQFRGRVGRGDYKSYCFLFTTSEEQSRSRRLRAMEKEDSGFRLAEIDLLLRGPGDLYGVRQSGMPEGVIAGLLQPELVVRARRAAERLVFGESEKEQEWIPARLS